MSDDDTWSVKDVVADLKSDLVKRFDQQDTALASIRTQLSTTATKADVQSLRGDLTALGGRVGALEDDKKAAAAVRTFRRRVWAAVVAASGVAASIAMVLEFAHP